MKIERIKRIEQYLIEHESATLDTLCSVFNVSKNTIRRDISELESKGVIKKVYGGVTLNYKEETVPFQQRQAQHTSEKSKIGVLASDLINNGDIIFIDSGSTTVHLIPNIKDKQNITIITNSLNIIVESAPYANLNVISTGGILQRKTNSFAGIATVNFLKSLNIDKAFMATTGISIEKGVTNTTYLEAEIKKLVVKISDKIVVMADHTKIDKAAFMRYCDLSDIDYFATNNMPSLKYIDFFERNHVQLLYSNPAK
ncbi:MAG: DeoR/GlpR family DNA-binding transcription regulator [Clostridia bacterium]|nr:DeoR/GlpR family DNA-binding transcription regulator [Clostridia bacterium]